MSTGDSTTALPRVSGRTVSAYLGVLAIVYLGAIIAIYFGWRRSAAYAVAGVPVALFLITQPRLALYQFIGLLFIQRYILFSAGLLLIDLSAGLVILAALVDVLSSKNLPKSFPRLAVYMVVLLIAMFISAVFGRDFLTSLRPIGRVLFLLATLLAAIRLTRYVSVKKALAIYFWSAVAFSFPAVIPFLASGGSLRSFGLAPMVFDELTMMALPIGLCFYLWSEQGKGWYYLLGSGMVFLGLIATQSRAPIFFGLVSSVIVLWISYRRAGKMLGSVPETDDLSFRAKIAVRRKIIWLAGASLVCVAAVTVAIPGALAAVSERFERLLTFSPGGTFAIRLVLWKWALIAFRDHPFLGIGPGQFRSLSELYPYLHLTPLQWYLRSLSAHNLLLHYLAETGIVGAGALLTLFVSQFRMSLYSWRHRSSATPISVKLAIFILGFLMLGTTVVEAGWMWGQTGFIMVFFLSLISRQYTRSRVTDSK